MVLKKDREIDIYRERMGQKTSKGRNKGQEENVDPPVPPVMSAMSSEAVSR